MNENQFSYDPTENVKDDDDNFEVIDDFNDDSIVNRLILQQSSSLKLSSFLPTQTISISLFELIFIVVTDLISDYAKSFVDNSEINNMRNVEVAFQVVRSVSNSDQRSLLIPYFYRVIVAKAGIHAKFTICSFMKRYVYYGNSLN
jgi:hypothetical protein